MSTYIRTATVLVRVNTGPPTWWKPSLGVEPFVGGGGFHVKAGWLRVCVQFGIGTKRHHAEEAL